MTLLEWAKNEVAIACKRERDSSGTPEGEWDYGCACYESALKAYKSLVEDGHSGLSISLTKQILCRLIDGKPLSPIEDTDDIWSECKYGNENGVKHYKCNRMSSLYKDVYPDGTVKYRDTDRCFAVNIDKPNVSYTNKTVRDVIDQMFPITMPYVPSNKPIKVVCEEWLTEPFKGDFNMIGILYAFKDDKKYEINRYFREINGKMVQIPKSSYEERKKHAKKV